nr:helix-turn-helix domain-containing protein [Sphingobacterium hungaricum]
MLKKTSTYQENKRKLSDSCSVNDTLSFIGKRWLMTALYEISLGCDQFSTLKNKIPGISEQMLASRIEDLVKKGLIVKEQIRSTTPVQIAYSITNKGSDLLKVLNTLDEWTNIWEYPQQ